VTRLQRSQSLALIFLVGAFLIGTGVGVAGYKAYHSRPRCVFEGEFPNLGESMSKEWKLSQAQIARLDSIGAVQEELYENIYKPYQPLLDSVREQAKARGDSLQEQIRQTLTPEQRERYDRQLAESKACSESWKRSYEAAKARRKKIR
jgi:hypothetical protein